MAVEKRDKDGHILMDYPFETSIPLEKRIWVSLAQYLLRLEKLDGLNVELQPGKWYESKEKRTSFFGPLIDLLIGDKTIYLLGSHVAYFGLKKQKTYEVIHLAVNREDKEIFSTLLHEVAHAKHIGNDHGKLWEAEYLRLMEDYYSFQSVGEVYKGIRAFYESSNWDTE